MQRNENCRKMPYLVQMMKQEEKENERNKSTSNELFYQ